MIVRHFEDILPSPRAVHADTWSSFRLLTRDDGMGFSLHETWIHPGTQTHIWYKHHYEAVYCIEGQGEIVPIDAQGDPTGAPIAIKPGVMYALNAHDRHLLRARTRLRLICVFNPPLRGDETHGPDGAYPAAEADGALLPGLTPAAATPPPAPAQAETLREAGKAGRHDPAVATAPTTTAASAEASARAFTSHSGGNALDHVNGDDDPDDDGEEEKP